MIKVNLIFAIGTIFVLAGCQSANVQQPQAGGTWKDADSAGVPVTRGAKECKAEAISGAGTTPGVSRDPGVMADLYDLCMRRRGY